MGVPESKYFICRRSRTISFTSFDFKASQFEVLFLFVYRKPPAMQVCSEKLNR